MLLRNELATTQSLGWKMKMTEEQKAGAKMEDFNLSIQTMILNFRKVVETP